MRRSSPRSCWPVLFRALSRCSRRRRLLRRSGAPEPECREQSHNRVFCVRYPASTRAAGVEKMRACSRTLPAPCAFWPRRLPRTAPLSQLPPSAASAWNLSPMCCSWEHGTAHAACRGRGVACGADCRRRKAGPGRIVAAGGWTSWCSSRGSAGEQLNDGGILC
jgi:hypothetical protein